MNRLARRVRAATLGVAVLLAVMSSLPFLASVPHWLTVEVDTGGLPRSWALGVAVVGNALLVAALIALARMLALVEHGETFAPAATRRFRWFALLVMLSALAKFLLPPLIQLGLVVWGGPRSFMLGVDDNQLLQLLIGVLLFLVARLFDEAARLQEDSRSII